MILALHTYYAMLSDTQFCDEQMTARCESSIFPLFFWDPWTNFHVWTVKFLSVCMYMYSKNNSIENIWNGNIRKNNKRSPTFIPLKKKKENPKTLIIILHTCDTLLLSSCQAETDNIYQNTDHLQLWKRSPWKEEKIQLIIWPFPKVMIESFVKTPLVKDGHGHRMCGRIQWLGAICGFPSTSTIFFN